MNLVEDFCLDYDFPMEATQELSRAFEKLQNNTDSFSVFCKWVDAYEKNEDFESKPAFESIHALKTETGLHPFTLELLYMIAMTPHLKKQYIEENLSDEIYRDSVADLKWKAFECKENYGVWGMFVGWWTIGFFRLKRFGFGRLQFNLREFPYDMAANGLSFQKGDLYLDTHIPSSGPLLHEKCLESYRRAASFFKERYKLHNIIFGCRSWLLSPNNEKILPSTSNVLPFARDYTILETTKQPDNPDMWRIFGTMKKPDKCSDLPSDNSLRRAFIRWLEAGGSIDSAFGVIVWNEKGENKCVRAES